MMTRRSGRDNDLLPRTHSILQRQVGRTDGLFYGYKGFEVVQLLCGQCSGDCYKQQPYVAAVAIS